MTTRLSKIHDLLLSEAKSQFGTNEGSEFVSGDYDEHWLDIEKGPLHSINGTENENFVVFVRLNEKTDYYIILYYIRQYVTDISHVLKHRVKLRRLSITNQSSFRCSGRAYENVIMSVFIFI